MITFLRRERGKPQGQVRHLAREHKAPQHGPAAKRTGKPQSSARTVRTSAKRCSASGGVKARTHVTDKRKARTLRTSAKRCSTSVGERTCTHLADERKALQRERWGEDPRREARRRLGSNLQPDRDGLAADGGHGAVAVHAEGCRHAVDAARAHRRQVVLHADSALTRRVCSAQVIKGFSGSVGWLKVIYISDHIPTPEIGTDARRALRAADTRCRRQRRGSERCRHTLQAPRERLALKGETNRNKTRPASASR